MEQSVDAVGRLIKGADANENELGFYGYTRLSTEIAE